MKKRRPFNREFKIQDFVHKLAIVLKELKESRGWLRFIIKAKLLPAQKMVELEDEATQLSNIIAKSIVTTKENQGIG